MKTLLSVAATKKFLFILNGGHYSKPQLDIMQRSTDCGEPSLSVHIYIKAPASRAQGTAWDRMTLRVRLPGSLLGISFYQKQPHKLDRSNGNIKHMPVWRRKLRGASPHRDSRQPMTAGRGGTDCFWGRPLLTINTIRSSLRPYTHKQQEQIQQVVCMYLCIHTHVTIIIK